MLFNVSSLTINFFPYKLLFANTLSIIESILVISDFFKPDMVSWLVVVLRDEFEDDDADDDGSPPCFFLYISVVESEYKYVE